MAKIEDWQRQSQKKSGAQTLSVGSMHPKLSGVAKFADGGEADEASLKAEGLAISNKEAPTGFFQRLREGNIDDPSSEAYSKYGAGRARIERSNAAQTANELDASASATRAEADRVSAAAVAAKDSETPAKYDKGEFEGLDEAIEKQKNSPAAAAPAPARAKPVAAKPAAAPSAPASPSKPAESVVRIKPAPAPVDDKSFNPSGLNFGPAPAAPKQEEKMKARTVQVRSRSWYSGQK